MAGLVEATLVTDTLPSTGVRHGGRLARLRTTPGRLRASVSLVVLLACGFGLVTGIVFAALDSGFTAIGGHDAPLVEQSTALYYAVNDMDAQVGNVLLTGSDPALAADRQQDMAIYASDRQHAEQDLQAGGGHRGRRPGRRAGGEYRARRAGPLRGTGLAPAIAFDIGTSPGQSDWAFNRWDSALGSVITI